MNARFLLPLIFFCIQCARNPGPQETRTMQSPSPPSPNPIASPDSRPTNSQPRVLPAALDSEEWRQWIRVLWQSTLGTMLTNYLQLPVESPDLTVDAHHITNRVFTNADEMLTRIAALQALVEDLYQRGQLSEDYLRKIMILQLDISRQAWAVTNTPKSVAAQSIPYLLVAAMIAGSPEVQRQASAFGEKLYRASSQLVESGTMHGFREVRGTLNWRRLFSKKFVEGYNPISAATAFFTIFPPGLSLFYLVFDRNPRLVGERLSDQLWRYGKDHIDEMRNL